MGEGVSFEAALLADGLRPREVIADGRIHRCVTESKPGHRNGWYVLHPDGHGAWGDWASGGGLALGTWRAEVSRSIEQAGAVAALSRQRDRDRTERVAAMARARQLFANAAPLQGSPKYLAHKGLTMEGCTGLRTWGGQLVVPVRLDHALISVQTISDDGEKRFFRGAPVKGGAYVLTRPRSALTAFVEGLATGLAVYQCVPHCSVVVCFDAGNLAPVIQRMRPSGSVVIAADNDWRTQARRGVNPGLDKARAAAALVGCGVAWPESIEGSDWCDAMSQWGEGAPRRIARLILAKAVYVIGAGA